MEPETHTTESQPPVPESPKSADESNKKLFGILGYIIPILFFLPLLNDSLKTNPFSRFHANQQLMLLITYIGITAVLNMFMMSMYMMYNFAQLIHIALFALAVYGAYNAYKGEMKELPVIGQFKIL